MTTKDPAWYQNMVAANAVHHDIISAQGGPYQIREDDSMTNTITMMAGSSEMIKVGPEGFWVRGVKVEQDANEAKAVYEGFKAWMVWAQLSRDYK